eukprot:13175143-Alexandrium_andersonii.AAC.1
MSASLVGSEMCIRDRLGPIGACLGSLRPAGPNRADWCKGPARAERLSLIHISEPTRLALI